MLNFLPTVVEAPETHETDTAAVVAAAVVDFTNLIRTELPFLVRQGMADALVQSIGSTTRTGLAVHGTETPNTQVAVDVVMEGFTKLAREFHRSSTDPDSTSLELPGEQRQPPPRITIPEGEKWLQTAGTLTHMQSHQTAEDVPMRAWPLQLQGCTTYPDVVGYPGAQHPFSQWLEEVLPPDNQMDLDSGRSEGGVYWQDFESYGAELLATCNETT